MMFKKSLSKHAVSQAICSFIHILFLLFLYILFQYFALICLVQNIWPRRYITIDVILKNIYKFSREPDVYGQINSEIFILVCFWKSFVRTQ